MFGKLLENAPGEEVVKVDEDVFIVNRMPAVSRYMEGMGRLIGFDRTGNADLRD